MSRAPADKQSPASPSSEQTGPEKNGAHPDHPVLVNPQGQPLEAPAAHKAHEPWYRRPVVLIAGGALLVLIVAGIVYWWFFAHGHETTDDAFITADVTSVSPQVAGHVLTVNVDDNQNVPQGQLLVQIDPRDFNIALSNSQTQLAVSEGQFAQAQSQVGVNESQVEQAKADVATAQANDWQAQQDLARYQKLSSEAVSRQTLDQATASAREADANLNSAEQKQAAAEAQVKFAQSQVKTAGAQVEQAKVAVANAQQQLAYTTITAPIAGTVTNRTVNVGDYVQAGQALLGLVPHSTYVIANFKETQLAHMQPGQSVKLHVDAFPGRTFYGRINSIERGTGAAFSLLPPENATGNYVKVVQRVPVKILFDPMPTDVQFAPGTSVEPDVNIDDQ